MFYLLVFISNLLLKNSNAAPPDKTISGHPFRFPYSSYMLSRRQAYPKHISNISHTSLKHLSSNHQTYFGRPSNLTPTRLKPLSNLSQLTFKPHPTHYLSFLKPHSALSQTKFKPLPSYPPVNLSFPSSNSRLSYLGNATCHFCNGFLSSLRQRYNKGMTKVQQRYNKILTLSTPTRDNRTKIEHFFGME